MSYEPTSPGIARSELGAAVRFGGDVAAARASLTTSNLDAAIRAQLEAHRSGGGQPLNDVQTAHLVSLVLSAAGVSGAQDEALYEAIRREVQKAQS